MDKNGELVLLLRRVLDLTLIITVLASVLCDHCRGTGAASDGDVVKCGGCNGQGVKVQRAQVFPGM